MRNPMKPSHTTGKSPRSTRGRWNAIIAVVVVYVVARLGWLANVSPPADLHEGDVAVVRVVDGDTLVLDHNVRVRLIGVNCPESVKPDTPVEPFGLEASNYTKREVAKVGDRVRLQFDRERYDIHGRTLAFVWLGDRMLNEELLREGLARWEPHFNYASAMKTRFRKAESEARDARRGVWSKGK